MAYFYSLQIYKFVIVIAGNGVIICTKSDGVPEAAIASFGTVKYITIRKTLSLLSCTKDLI
jgi:hypothetical protein